VPIEGFGKQHSIQLTAETLATSDRQHKPAAVAVHSEALTDGAVRARPPAKRIKLRRVYDSKAERSVVQEQSAQKDISLGGSEHMTDVDIFPPSEHKADVNVLPSSERQTVPVNPKVWHGCTSFPATQPG
jgi:hypothetical protein